MSYQDHQYERTIIADAMCNLANLKQKEEKSFINYTGRFKSPKDIQETELGGPIRLTKFIETMKDNKTPEMSERQTYEHLMTYFYLRNADRFKYGTLFTGLSSQYSFGQDQFPRLS
jgi:hypothetical protein